MPKYRKHIALVLILNFMLFSSGQAYILSECECTNEIAFDSELNTCSIEIESDDCCSTDFSASHENIIKIRDSHSTSNCVTGCSFTENQDVENPSLYAYTSFSLKKIINTEFTYVNFNRENENSSEIDNRFTQLQNEKFYKLYGKDLLILTHTLKIPLILS